MEKPLSRLSEIPAQRIDAIDRKILLALAIDGRRTSSVIGKDVRRSRDAVSYRITAMQKRGIIAGFVPVVDMRALGYQTFQVFLLTDERKPKQELFDHLVDHPNTLSMMVYTDTWDVCWTLVAKDIQEFDAIMTLLLTEHQDIVSEKEYHAVINNYIDTHVPHASEVMPPRKEGSVEIDDIDRMLLALLCRDARRSTYELGRLLDCSPDTVGKRMRRLREGGVISSFTVLPDIAALGRTWYTYVMRFKRFGPSDEKKLRTFAAQNPQIINACKIFGTWDVQLTIVPDSLQSYHETIKALKKLFADTILAHQTWLANQEVFFTALPKVIENAGASRS